MSLKIAAHLDYTEAFKSMYKCNSPSVCVVCINKSEGKVETKAYVERDKGHNGTVKRSRQ